MINAPIGVWFLLFLARYLGITAVVAGIYKTLIMRVEGETDNDDEDEDGNELGDRHDPVDGRRLADSSGDQVMEEPHKH